MKVPADFSLYSHQVEMSLVPFGKSNLNDIPPELQIPYGKFVNFFLKKKKKNGNFFQRVLYTTIKPAGI